MFKSSNKGFTLIELLVVIAIIGILAGVVVGRLNTAKDKGTDAAIKATMSSMRNEAQIYYDDGKTYTGVCAQVGDSTIGRFVVDAIEKAGTAETLVRSCHADDNEWVAAVTLKGGEVWCADFGGYTGSTSKSIISDTAPSDGDIDCQ